MKICTVCATSFESEIWHCPNCAWVPATAQGCTVLSQHDEPVEGYRGDYFAPLAEIESRHFWFRARNQVILYALRRYFADMKSFLEIGCGTGFVLSGVRETFPAIALAGAEYFAEGLAFAQGRVPEAAFYKLDARQLPFSAEFDVIGAFDVIEHIKEDERVLAEMYRAVKPGGGIILTVPQHRFLWSVADEYKHHERRYARADLIDKVKKAGFTPVYTTSFVSTLLPVMLLSRLIQNRAKKRPDRMTELRIKPIPNRVMSAVMGAEVFAIRRGIRLPMGGSLLLIARKGNGR